MTETTRSSEEEGDSDLHTLVDDLLTDFGSFAGEPKERTKVVRRLIHGAGLTEEGVLTLHWYFDHVEGKGSLSHMGGFVFSKLKTSEAAKDTLKVAEKIRARIARKDQGPNQVHRGDKSPKDPELEARLLEKDLRMAVCYHVLDLKWDPAKAAEYHGIEEGRVRDIVRDGPQRVLPSGDLNFFYYMRQKDRPSWMRYQCWLDGRKPIPQEEVQDPRKQPQLEAMRDVGMVDDIGPVYGE